MCVMSKRLIASVYFGHVLIGQPRTLATKSD